MKKLLSAILTLFMLMSTTIIVVHADQLNEGIYNFECVDGGRYLNVYAGYDWDGANVCVWEKDGSPEQNFKMVDRGGNRYVLYPQSSNGRVLDANRGNSYNNPLQAGNNIDIWQTNDAPAQEWYIDDRGGGKYTIELANARGLVVTCDNPGTNNGNCTLQQYNGSSNQLWYLHRADGGEIKPTTSEQPDPSPTAPKPETTRTGYVANTGGIVLRVRAEANTNCAVLGTLNEGSAITVKGDDKINGFWKVDFNGSEGYCHGDYISFNKPSSGSNVNNQSKFADIVNRVGCQTRKSYANWDWMCGSYCVAYARSYLDNNTRYAGDFWINNVGANWGAGGGSSMKLGSDSQVLATAKASLDKGRPCVVTVNSSYGQHYVLAIYYSGSGTQTSDFVVVDPWNGAIKSLGNYTINNWNKQVVTF